MESYRLGFSSIYKKENQTNFHLTVRATIPRVRHPWLKISDKRINQGSGGGKSLAGDIFRWTLGMMGQRYQQHNTGSSQCKCSGKNTFAMVNALPSVVVITLPLS